MADGKIHYFIAGRIMQGESGSDDAAQIAAWVQDNFAAQTVGGTSVYLLAAAEGGRRTEVRTGYRPQFFVRTTDVVGVLDLGPARTAAPGELITATIELGQPVALEPGLGFAIREGGRTVGAGTVERLLD